MTRRRLTSEEKALWEAVRRTVRKLDPGNGPDGEPPIAPPPPAARLPDVAQTRPPADTGAPAAHSRPQPAYYPPQSRSKAGTKIVHAAPLAEIDRKTRRSISGGRLEIDARLDLHGLTQTIAHSRLLYFLQSAQAEGYKLVLVITGKGRGGAVVRHPEPERGILRAVVPDWLELPEFRRYVLASHTSHVQHGGEGAIYILIRRRKTAV